MTGSVILLHLLLIAFHYFPNCLWITQTKGQLDQSLAHRCTQLLKSVHAWKVDSANIFNSFTSKDRSGVTVTNNTSMQIINILQNFHICHLEPSLWLRAVERNKHVSSMRKWRLRDKGIWWGHPANKWHSHDRHSGLLIPNLLLFTLGHFNSSKAGRQSLEPRTAETGSVHHNS